MSDQHPNTPPTRRAGRDHAPGTSSERREPTLWDDEQPQAEEIAESQAALPLDADPVSKVRSVDAASRRAAEYRHPSEAELPEAMRELPSAGALHASKTADATPSAPASAAARPDASAAVAPAQAAAGVKPANAPPTASAGAGATAPSASAKMTAPTAQHQPPPAAAPSSSQAEAIAPTLATEAATKPWKAPSHWRFPRPGRRSFAVVLRNFLVWRKLVVPSLVGSIAEPLFWLIAFGYGMGALVGQVQLHGQAVPYILFLASGSICMSAMNTASFEGLYSAFSRMHQQRTWDGILNAPVSLDDIVVGEMLWATFKSFFSVCAILLVMWLLGISHAPKLLFALPLLVLVGMMFASIALVATALAKGFDFFTFYFTLALTPMTFLSGVFFPREQLPDWLYAISEWLPLTNAVELVRPLFLNEWPSSMPRHTLLVLLYLVASIWLACALTRRRFAR